MIHTTMRWLAKGRACSECGTDLDPDNFMCRKEPLSFSVDWYCSECKDSCSDR